MLNKIIKELLKPPNFIFLSEGKYIKLYQPNKYKFLILLDIPKQIILWIYKLITIKKYFKFNQKQKIPLDYFVKAVILNNFSLIETAFWYKNNIKTWDKLAELKPEYFTKVIHYKSRLNWPKQCIDSINILHNKPKLYSYTPAELRPEFFIINNKHDFTGIPIEKYLGENGLIIKPINGSRGINTFHIFKKGENLIIKTLFYSRREHIFEFNDLNNCIKNIKLFINIKRIKTKLLLMPYLENSSFLPRTYPSIIFRTITSCTLNNKQISIKEAWMELSDKKNNLYYLSHEDFLFSLYNPLKKIKDLEKDLEFSFNKKELKNIYKELFRNSIKMHSLLPPINQVAWDWIQTNSNLYLLEGNSGFSFFPLKYFQKNKKKIY